MTVKNQPINPLINVDELVSLQSIADGNLVVLDCSWHLPTASREARKEFEQSRIPGARFFDIDAISDPDSTLPHMLPSGAAFETSVRELNVSADSHVVVYDSVGLFSAARVWWMFRIFGHDKVQILDGGLPAWLDSGALGSAELNVNESGPLFTAVLDSQKVVSKIEVQEAISHEDVLILDARSRERFNGEVAEPRKGLASGHIPGSHCLPFSELLVDGRLRDKADLERLLISAGVSPDDILSGKQTVITTCGSGVTAAVITLALEVAGYGLQGLYDGSWSEWGLQT